MHSTKLLQLVKTLSKKELKAFTSFLHANYANSVTLVELFDHIVSFWGDWKNPNLQLDQLSNALGQGNSTKAISNKSSDLYRILLDYLVKKELDTDEYKFEKDMMVLAILEKRGLDRLKMQKWNALNKGLDQEDVRDSWSPLKKIQLHEMAYYNTESNKYDLKGITPENFLILLEEFNIGLKLKYACELLSRSQFLITKSHTSLYDSILAANINPTNYYQLIFHTLFKALYSLDFADYEKTLDLLKEGISRLTEEGQHLVFLYLVNFAAQQSRRDINPYGQGLLDLYKFGLTQGLLTNDQQISRVRFHNVIDIACKVNDITFAHQFIHDYQNYLPTENRSDTINLANIMVLFAKKNFSSAQVLLSTSNFKNLDEKFRSQSLELCCLYELAGSNEGTWNKCHAFKEFLNRNNKMIQGNFLRSVRTFINILEKIMQQEAKKEQIIDMLETSDHVIMKFWLLEKVVHYKKKY